jgi:hypothetical protein
MKKKYIEEILLINLNLVNKKLNNPSCLRTELTRIDLTKKINNMINEFSNLNS